MVIGSERQGCWASRSFGMLKISPRVLYAIITIRTRNAPFSLAFVSSYDLEGEGPDCVRPTLADLNSVLTSSGSARVALVRSDVSSPRQLGHAAPDRWRFGLLPNRRRPWSSRGWPMCRGSSQDIPALSTQMRRPSILLRRSRKRGATPSIRVPPRRQTYMAPRADRRRILQSPDRRGTEVRLGTYR